MLISVLREKKQLWIPFVKMGWFVYESNIASLHASQRGMWAVCVWAEAKHVSDMHCNRVQCSLLILSTVTSQGSLIALR